MKAKGIAVVFFAAAIWASASEENFENQTIDYGKPVVSQKPLKGSDYLRPLGVTLLLIGVAGGLFFLLRRFSSKKSFLRGKNIKVLETAYVSQKHSLSLVRVRNRILLLGMGQDVNLLTSFDQPEEVIRFDGEFSEELKEALKDDQGESSWKRSHAGTETFQSEVKSLRKFVGKWRDRLTKGVGT